MPQVRDHGFLECYRQLYSFLGVQPRSKGSKLCMQRVIVLVREFLDGPRSGFPNSSAPPTYPSTGNVPVVPDGVEHQLQVLGCKRSFTARYLFENTHTAKSAA